MKFVFTIHSPITFLMAYSLIKQENIPRSDIVVISNGYSPPISIGKVVKSFSEVSDTWYNKLSHLNIASAFDEYLEDIVESHDFVAFIDMMHNHQKLLITNSKCQAFHFFEEGTDSYMVPRKLTDFARTTVSKKFRYTTLSQAIKEASRVFRGYPTSLYSLPYHLQPYQYSGDHFYYCLHEFCYPGIDDKLKKVVSPNFTQDELDKISASYSINEGIFLVEETYPDKYGVGDQEYKTILARMIRTLDPEGERTLYLKLRPGKKVKESRMVKLLNEMGSVYEMVPLEAVAEGIFLSSTKLLVVGFVSSLLIYASIFGHKSFSLLKQIGDKENTRFDNINGFNLLVNYL